MGPAILQSLIAPLFRPWLLSCACGFFIAILQSVILVQHACYGKHSISYVVFVWALYDWRGVTSPWSSGKCVRFGAGRSRVRVLPRPCKLVLQPSYQGARCVEELQGIHLEHRNKPSEMKAEIV